MTWPFSACVATWSSFAMRTSHTDRLARKRGFDLQQLAPVSRVSNTEFPTRATHPLVDVPPLALCCQGRPALPLSQRPTHYGQAANLALFLLSRPPRYDWAAARSGPRPRCRGIFLPWARGGVLGKDEALVARKCGGKRVHLLYIMRSRSQIAIDDDGCLNTKETHKRVHCIIHRRIRGTTRCVSSS